METALLRNRAYSLIVGDPNKEVWEINDLNLSFDITKTSSNKDKTNSATIEIYNLSKDKQRLLEEDYIGAVFSAGYWDTGGPKRLFSGQVVDATTRKSGTDIITQIRMGANYTELNHSTLSKLVAPGKTYKDVIEELRKEIPGISRAVYNGTNLSNPVIDGYPLSGTARQMLNEITETAGLEWHVDDGVLYVNDNDGASTDDLNSATTFVGSGSKEVFVVGSESGLIELPYAVSGDKKRSKADKAKKDGVQFKTLINPELIPGSIILLEDETFQGYWKIDAIRTYGEYRGQDWYTDIRCSQKVKV